MTENFYTLNLKDLTKSDSNLTGSKAANLGELASRSFNVPGGFVISTIAYDRYLSEGDILVNIQKELVSLDYSDSTSIREVSERIRKIVKAAQIPSVVTDAIGAAYSTHGSKRVAIRSSATAEDLPDASFAGQYETYLNIEGVLKVIEKVRECYASLWTPRAISYRHAQSIPHDGVKIAVVIQNMVLARSAGVLFTRNPNSNDDEEVMIESNFGLGESVVSGEAIPDRYIVAGSKQSEYRVLSKEIGTKEVIIYADPISGIKHEAVDEETGQTASLSDEEAIELAKIGHSIESAFGSPQDIEWAYDQSGELFILQSRPITTDYSKPDEEILWTRGYSDDYWNDNVTPLFFDLLGGHLKYIVNIELNDIMGYKEMTSELILLRGAHVYFNLDVIRNKVLNEMPPFIRSDDVLNYFPEGHGPFGKDTMRKLPFRLKARILAELRVMMYDGDGSISKTADVYKSWTDEVFIPFLQEFDDSLEEFRDNGSLADLMKLADSLDRVMVRHFRLVRYGLPVHNLGMNLIANYLLTRYLGVNAAARLYPILISDLDHKTNETNERVNELADRILSYPDVREAILSKPSKELDHYIKEMRTENSSAYMEAYEEFQREFGVRGFTREPYYPRWHEAPELVYDMLKPLVKEKGYDLRAAKAESKRVRKQAEIFVEKQVKAIRFGKIKLFLFNAILGICRTYITFRENQRFNLDRWITRNRNLYLEVGRRFTKQGLLSDPSHIFFLYRREIRRSISGDDIVELSETVDKRFQTFKQNENRVPPKFIQGSRQFDDPLPESEVEATLKGIPASQGVTTSTVRVLRTIEEIIHVRAGEILVVPRTDPGWTPVFSRIGGLITETGGILSHGAVVSREYGIPAVTNIRQACKTFVTGQTVTIDGSSGTVLIHSEED
ncbi:MAG: PEP/pyruvate-binding domain-containing protein [Candidatus Thorarchaeota archaeon]